MQDCKRQFNSLSLERGQYNVFTLELRRVAVSGKSGTSSGPARKFGCASRSLCDSSCVRRWRNLKFRLIPCGIVNARHRAIPALPYTRCLTHPDVFLRCISCIHETSRVAPILFACGIYPSWPGNCLAFNETTLILPESRHRCLRFQWTCDSELDILLAF